MIAAPGFPQSEESIAFLEALDDLLVKHCDSAALRAAWDTTEARIPGLWKRLDDLGLFDFVTERGLMDGLGDAVAAAVVLGRYAAPEPFLGSLAASVLTGKPTPMETAVVGRPGSLVVDASVASQFVIASTDGGFEVVLRSDLTVTRVPSIDPSARLGTIDRTHNTAEGQQLDVMTTLAAAALQGLAEGLLSQTVEYARLREQFGKPIGSFQAIKHHLADVYTALAFSRPVIEDAARSVWHPHWSARASHAKVAATSAAHRAARTALQVHGGIGYTFEHDLHMWTKKVWTLSTAWGDSRWHAARMAAAALAEE